MPTSAPAAKRSASKVLGTFLVIGLLLLVVVLDMRRRSVEAQLSQLSMRLSQLNGNTEQNKKEAQDLIGKLRKMYDLPTGVDPTVATIVDVAALQKQNDFYLKAHNGDHLFVTSERAILTNANVDFIIDVVPVTVQQPAAAANQLQGQVSNQKPAAAKKTASSASAPAATAASSISAQQ